MGPGVRGAARGHGGVHGVHGGASAGQPGIVRAVQYENDILVGVRVIASW